MMIPITPFLNIPVIIATYFLAGCGTTSDSANNNVGDSGNVTVTGTSGGSASTPVADNQDFTIASHQNVTSALAVSNSAGSPISFSVVIPPRNGTFSMNSATGIFSYTPYSDFTGVDFFTWNCSNADGTSNNAETQFTVPPSAITSASTDRLVIASADIQR